jgi:hypothetical protein
MNKLDFLLNKLISRKLSVFVIASIALFSHNLDGKDWVIISTAYISLQGFTDIVKAFMQVKTNINV